MVWFWIPTKKFHTIYMHVFVIQEVSCRILYFVCHFYVLNYKYKSLLGTSMGHYTSYTKHIESEEWYFYNDETATKATPGPEDYSNAYILFYKKQGTYVIVSYIIHTIFNIETSC